LSRARTIAIAGASHEILVLPDDDMLVQAEWFGIIVRALLRVGPTGVVTGQVLPTVAEAPGGFQLSIKVDPRPAVYRGRIGQDPLAGGHMAAYRAAITAVGGFDARLGPGAAFPAAEDNDLGFRLLEAGYAIHYVPQAVVYHRAWRTSRHYLPLRWSYGVGQGAFYAKHLHGRDLYMLRRLGHDLRYFVRRPLRLIRERRWAVGYAVFLLGELVGAGRWLVARRAGGAG
jgi:GT2 family glycosyltransferase